MEGKYASPHQKINSRKSDTFTAAINYNSA
jgi:hypothetical protein